MKKISFNIIYWDGFDSESRFLNLKFCIKSIVNFCNYAANKGLDIKLFIFDFSESKLIDDAIHIPYPNSEFKKSEKINKVIEYNHLQYNPDIFCYLDNDIVFLENEYDHMIENLISMDNFGENSILNNDVLEILNPENVDHNHFQLYFPINVNIKSIRGCGPFYFIPFKKLFEMGGYDERFTVWGGEDDDMYERLVKSGCHMHKTNMQLFHLPHKSMMSDAHKTPQYYRQCDLIGNNDIITKFSLITKKYLNNEILT